MGLLLSCYWVSFVVERGGSREEKGPETFYWVQPYVTLPTRKLSSQYGVSPYFYVENALELSVSLFGIVYKLTRLIFRGVKNRL